MPATVDLTSALERARRALAHLEAQAAGFGALHIPVDLQIELEEKRREVADLEARMNAPAPATAPTAAAAPGNTYVTYIERAEGFAIGDGAQVFQGRSTPIAPPAPASTTALRQALARLDDVELDALCLDHFPAVYDKFGPSLRHDQKFNLLLDHCRRHPEALHQLNMLLRGRA